MRKKIGIGIGIVAVTMMVGAFSWTALGNRPHDTQTSVIDRDSLTTLETIAVGQLANPVQSVEELVKDASLVVLGRLQGIDGTRNMARDPNDPSKEDATIVVEGLNYRVVVEAYWKGDGPKELIVTVPKTISPRPGVKATYGSFKEMPPGGRYVLFLRPSTDGTDTYVGAGEPWRFKVNNGKAEVFTNFKELGDRFVQNSADAFEEQVRAALKK